MKILIVEDEEKLARFTELELKHEGYETAKAFDGRIGLEMAESGEFDLILLDIMLPGLNGIEVLRRIRKTSEVPVILLTARDSVMDKVSGLDTGADDYITKPFDIEELLARIRAALRKRTVQTETSSAALSFGAEIFQFVIGLLCQPLLPNDKRRRRNIEQIIHKTLYINIL